MLLGLVVGTAVGFTLGNDEGLNVGEIDGDRLEGFIVVGLEVGVTTGAIVGSPGLGVG
jgi:hypothetical protein